MSILESEWRRPLRSFAAGEKRFRLRLTGDSRIPNQTLSSGAVLLVSLTALAPTRGEARNGELAGRRTFGVLGLAAGASVGAALALRARGSLRSVEEAYERLDRALAETEQAKDALALANAELGHENVEIRAMHVAFAGLLNLADERTGGRMRSLIEDTGEELAELLEEQMERAR